MKTAPEQSIGNFAENSDPSVCVVDEHNNEYCQKGKQLANEVLKKIEAVDLPARKQKLLPQQSKYLSELAQLFKELYSSSASVGCKSIAEQKSQSNRQKA